MSEQWRVNVVQQGTASIQKWMVEGYIYGNQSSDNFIFKKLHYKTMSKKKSIQDEEHDLLGSLLDDEDNNLPSDRHHQNQPRPQVSSAPPAFFDLGFKINEAFLENEDFDSPDPQDRAIKEAFTKKETWEFKLENQPIIETGNTYRKMSCDLQLLNYEENNHFQYDYYEYMSTLTPEEELFNNLSQVCQWSKDQYGSRTVQSIFENQNDEKKDAIFKVIYPDALSLIKDRFGNYVFQKIFEKGLQNHKELLVNLLEGNINDLSLHAYGCRVVQKAVQFISEKEQLQQRFMKQIMIAPIQLIQNQNGNHVIQKCFQTFPHQLIEPLANILIDKVEQLSFHPYGCRVIQKYLENYREQQKCQYILQKLLGITIPLSQCQYGNYVMQHIVTKCIEERKQVFSTFILHIVELSINKYASNVIEKAIQSPGTQFCEKLADWFMKNMNELIMLSKHQFGNYVIQSTMNKACKQKKVTIKNILKERASEISQSQYGRHVLLQLDKIRIK